MRVGRMYADDPVQTLADALDLEPSSGFGARVRDGIEADRAARRRTWRYAMAVAVPAAVALVVVWSAHRPIDEQPRAMSSRAGAVMPSETLLLPVGGVTPDNMAAYLAASADGFGIGSALYKPGIDAAELKRRATAFVRRLQGIRQNS